MEDDGDWYRLKDIRAIYCGADRRSSRTVRATRSGALTTYVPLKIDVKVVGWAQHDDGRQPMVECNSFDKEHLRCGAYERRPEHCRTYDCRDDEPADWRARPHCDIGRHRREEAAAV